MENNDSILDSIKKVVLIPVEDDSFDVDLIMHINTTFSILRQLGVGPVEGFLIKDNKALWSEYINDDKRLEMVKTYIALKTQLVFDPPASATLLDAKNNLIAELEFRLNSIVDYEMEKGGRKSKWMII